MHDLIVPVVAIPARNEEALLPRLIAALARQTIVRHLHQPLRVVLVLNNTDDRSLAAALEAAAHAPQLRMTIEEEVFPLDQAHVGQARHLAMEIAAREAPSGVILTTDADAVPSDNWVENNLRAIRSGIDLVGGQIIGDRQEEETLGAGFLRRALTHARYASLRDELAWLIDPIDHDPWPRHRDHTGASIAVRSDVYRATGGMDPLPFREDLAFVSKVVAAGYRLSHPLDVVVTVSARTNGRAPGGMADCLRSWVREEMEGVPLLLECPDAIERRLHLRRSMRALAQEVSSVVCPTSAVKETRQQEAVRYAGVHWNRAMIERLMADDPDAIATVPASIAVAKLERRIADLRRVANAA
ncbi:MAG: glycosyltransferase [Aliihoeflea sp.]